MLDQNKSGESNQEFIHPSLSDDEDEEDQNGDDDNDDDEVGLIV